MSDRSTQMRQWLDRLGYRDYTLSAASEDASFRSYLRLQTSTGSLIVMDAPPQRESCDSFVSIAQKLRAAGLNAPQIFAQDFDSGFLLLSDFGSEDYLSRLDADSRDRLYADALDALLMMQTRIDSAGLPLYDEPLLHQEMDLFHDWFLGRLLGLGLDAAQQRTWRDCKHKLAKNALAQPQVFVHRDYHSRNLMTLAADNPGILDFQDAVRGPVTYDLVSLLRDCYIAWPAAQVESLALEYFERARDRDLVRDDAVQFLHWFNLMGIQRHLKAIGIFSRLKLRDGKDGFIRDIPRTLGYLREVSAAEPSMAGLSELVEALALEARMAAS